jgi:hypothetical protein
MTKPRSALPGSFEELLGDCIHFCKRSRDDASEERARARRAKLADFVRLFHSECSTLTADVQKSIERLKSGNCVVLMTAHQPNFFAYSGVLRKATLNYVLAKRLEAAVEVPVVSFFGIADQDFSDDRWVKSCELPSVLRSGGVLSLEAKLPEKMMLNNVAKPSHDLLLSWEAEVGKWLDDSIKSVVRLGKSLGYDDALSASDFSALRKNLSSFWNIVEDCWKNSQTFSDFNGFLISKIVNNAWGYDTIFARFSECQQAFADDFAFLLSRFEDYSRFMEEAIEAAGCDSCSGGVSDQEPHLIPFWYHCSCGSKAKLLYGLKNGHVTGSGSCVRCRRNYDLDFGRQEYPDLAQLASKISARAITMALVFFRGLQPSCYVGGAGGLEYLAEAEHVSKGLDILFPPVVIWRPRDTYIGVGQAEGLLEIKRICDYLGALDSSEAKTMLGAQISEARQRVAELEQQKGELVDMLRGDPDNEALKQEMKAFLVRRAEFVRSSNLSVLCRDLRIIDNELETLRLIPSIIDYAANCGLKETSTQWVDYLNEKGNFSNEVKLNSLLGLSMLMEQSCAKESKP